MVANEKVFHHFNWCCNQSGITMSKRKSQIAAQNHHKTKRSRQNNNESSDEVSINKQLIGFDFKSKNKTLTLNGVIFFIYDLNGRTMKTVKHR